MFALVVLYILPGMAFSYKSVQEPWTLFRLARASLSLPAGRIAAFSGAASAYRGEHLGGELLQSALIGLTGWPLESLALLPLGALILPALYFAVIRVISRSAWLALWLALFAAWYYPRQFSHYAVQTYVWTDALFLCFALLLYLWLLRPSPLLSLLLVVIFAAAFLHYQTTPLWMIVAVTAAVLLARWRKELYPADRRPPAWALPVLFVVIYLQFDTVFFGNFLGHLRQEPIDRLLAANIAGKVLAPLFGWQPAALGEYAAAPLSPRLATWTTLLAILILIAPVLAWWLRKIDRAIRAKRFTYLVERVEDIFVWSLLAVAAAHALIYSFYGALSLRLIDLVFPLILPVVLIEFSHGRRTANVLAPALAVCAGIGFLSYTAALQPDILAAETGLAGDLLVDNSRILADANTFGGLSLNTSESGKLIELVWLDADRYASVAGDRPAGQVGFDYLVTDNQSKPIISQGWVFYEPWVDHLTEIEANLTLDQIYASDRVRVFQPAGLPLPRRLTEAVVSLDASRPAGIGAGRVFAALFLLLFAPGAALALLILPRLNLSGADTETRQVFLALAVGLSIAVNTCLGYLVNFTTLGLSWLLPLAVVLTVTALVIRLALPFPKPAQSLWPILLLVLASLAVWSLATTLVDLYRSQARQPDTEFFLTAGGAAQDQILANVVNRTSQIKTCSLRLEQGGHSTQELATFSLPPEAAWQAPVDMPGSLGGDRLVFILGCDRQLRFALHLNRLPSGRAGEIQATGEQDDVP
ncbi:MAG TPA: hypothetical protein VI776_02325 [Anaerolineales bacterium]|nr:hypothetical protein [Anaerolineales bacterium]